MRKVVDEELMVDKGVVGGMEWVWLSVGKGLGEVGGKIKCGFGGGG